MKKIICTLLAAVLLMGLLAACSGNKQNKPQLNIADGTDPTGGGIVDNVFDPTSDSSQAQDSTKATEAQNSATPTQGQQGSGTTQPTEGTKPTQDQQNSGATQPTEGTKPTQPEDPTTKPTQPTEEPTEQPTQSTELTGLAAEYKAYNNMTAAEKQKFRETFENNTAFFKWYNAALNAYKEATPAIPIPPDGNITLP